MDLGFGAGLVLGLLAGAGLVMAATRALAGYPEPARAYRVLTAGEAAFVAAAADAIFPAGGPCPPSGTQAGVPAYVDEYYARVPRSMRVLMRALLFLMEHATLVFPAPGRLGFRRFSALGTEQQVAVLDGWSRSRLFPRRLAFTSLRAILTMGYFGDPAVLRALGLAPLAIETPVRGADLLYPRVGRGPESIPYGPADRSAAEPERPLRPDDPVHPAYRERGEPAKRADAAGGAP